MFGEDSVPKMFKGEKLFVVVNDKRADIDLISLVSLNFVIKLFWGNNDFVRTSNVRMTKRSARSSTRQSPNCTSRSRLRKSTRKVSHAHFLK